MRIGTQTLLQIQLPAARVPLRLVVAAVSLGLFATLAVAPPDAHALVDPLSYQPELDDGPLGPGRQAYRERRDPARAIESYELFKTVVAENPDDPVALWHLAMSCYYLGQRVYDNSDDRRRIFEEGHKIAETAAERAPDCAPCHMLAGVNQALWGQEVGIFRVISGLPRVKRHLQLSTDLDPTFAGASALRVRSQIAQVLPSWLGGGKNRARSYLYRAIEIAPNEPLNYYFLAKLLLKDYGDRDKALEIAKRGLAVPPPGPEFVESVDSMGRLRSFVDKIQK